SLLERVVVTGVAGTLLGLQDRVQVLDDLDRFLAGQGRNRNRHRGHQALTSFRLPCWQYIPKGALACWYCLASGRHTVQEPDKAHPEQPPVRSMRRSATSLSRDRPSMPSAMRSIASSRPTLQIEARPCGSE